MTIAGTTVYTYDDADRTTAVTPPGQSPVTWTWDDNGNLYGATGLLALATALKTTTTSPIPFLSVARHPLPVARYPLPCPHDR